jgi:hypothetical protein
MLEKQNFFGGRRIQEAARRLPKSQSDYRRQAWNVQRLWGICPERPENDSFTIYTGWMIDQRV